MATPEYKALEKYRDGISKAVTVLLGKKEYVGTGKNRGLRNLEDFEKEYVDASREYLGSNSVNRTTGFVRAFMARLKEAAIMYHANPLNPQVYEELKKGVIDAIRPITENVLILAREHKNEIEELRIDLTDGVKRALKDREIVQRLLTKLLGKTGDLELEELVGAQA